MADTWPLGDPLEQGGGVAGWFKSALGTVKTAVAPQSNPALQGLDMSGFTGQIRRAATDKVLGQYPGYNDLWTYDAAEGVQITRNGAIALGVAGVVVYLVLFSGGR